MGDQVKVESYSATPDSENQSKKLDSFDESILILSSFINDHKDDASKVKSEPNSAEDAHEKQDDRSSLLLDKIESVTNQYKSKRALLNFKEQIREICRESKQLF